MDKTEKKAKKFKSQSFTNIVDIFTPSSYKEVYQPYLRPRNNNIVLRTSCNYNETCKYKQKTQLKQYSYVTSENYHALNINGSNKSVVRSTSTFFYDLDKIAKRHSYHYITTNDSNNKDSKCFHGQLNKNGFRVKTDTVIQDYEAQVKPKLKVDSNLKMKQNKAKKKIVDKPRLSSEIYLNDDSNIDDNIYIKQEDERLQKLWSFGKYNTEYAYPLTKEKKCRKDDRSKNIENPCPCQLFSYACPCTDKKSLTELAKSSKVLTVADQITSTSVFLLPTSKHNNSSKIENIEDKNNCDNTARNTDDFQKNSDDMKNTQCKPSIVTNTCTKNSTNIKTKPQKKPQKFICPRCKEKLEILSTTEDECSIISKNSPHCRNSCLESETYNANNVENIDICNHNPPCELIPVCQVLPNENECVNPKYVENVAAVKYNPKMIRITKACRHHPPCTVVPSCQRINVLKNNCEYIPPCLHHPRCVNLPLCVPVFKNIYYDDILDKQTEDKNRMERNYSPQYKYVSDLQHDSLNNNNVYQLHSSQNKCQCFKGSPKLNFEPEMSYSSPTSSPFNISPIKMSLKCCKSNKSCQYDCSDCLNRYIVENLKDNDYIETVVYIRDVGCQFKYNSLSVTNSLLYSKSSKAFYDFNIETNKFCTNFHKINCEDKYTNPVSGEELSMSTFTSSLEIDEDCPSHGKKAYRKGSTGFTSKSPYITAYANLTDPIFPNIYRLSSLSDNMRQKIDSSQNIETCSRLHADFVKTRKSIKKRKYKNLFSVKRRRKFRSTSNSKT